MFRLVCFGLVLLLCVNLSSQLKCLPCSEVSCLFLGPCDCPFGVGKDVCGCCPTCLKGPGERCGGSFGLFGTCGYGFVCVDDGGDILEKDSSDPDSSGTCVSYQCGMEHGD